MEWHIGQIHAYQRRIAEVLGEQGRRCVVHRSGMCECIPACSMSLLLDVAVAEICWSASRKVGHRGCAAVGAALRSAS